MKEVNMYVIIILLILLLVYIVGKYIGERAIKVKKQFIEGMHLFDIELVAPCNAQCYFCPQAWDGVKRDKPVQTKELILKIIRDLTDLSKDGKHIGVSFVGMGEPLLKKDLMLYFLENTPKDVVNSFGLVTNGYRLTEEFVNNPLMERFKWVQVSMTGWDSYESIYKLNPDKVRKNLIKSSKILGKRLRIAWVDDKRIPKHELDSARKWYKKYLKPYGVKFNTTRLHTRGGHYEYPGAFDDMGVRNFRNCGIFKNLNFISSCGHILSCCHDVESKNKIGNVYTESISSILKNKKEYQKHHSGFEICKKCNDFSFVTEIEKNELIKKGKWPKWSF